jgi:thiol-disulfide isomerase/thioredoxin
MAEFLQRVAVGAFVVLIVASQSVAAEFPASPAQWINAPPISRADLAGKAALLWFFEEDCPRCRAKWPDLIETAKEFESKPIVFIAVNSGSSRQEIERYVRQSRIPWPVVVDPNREFEKAVGLNEISLQNIHQVQLLMPNGEFRSGRWSDIKGSAEQVLANASFKVDQESIPATLRSAWADVEFGRFSKTAVSIKRSLHSSDAEIKAAAEKLHGHIQSEIEAKLKAAAKAKADNESWTAYQLYQAVLEQFGDYDLPSDVRSEVKQLTQDAAVREELTRQKQLELAIKQVRGRSVTLRKRGFASLKRVAETGTGDAAEKAKAILSQLENMGE